MFGVNTVVINSLPKVLMNTGKEKTNRFSGRWAACNAWWFCSSECKQGDNSHSCPFYREFSLAFSTATSSKWMAPASHGPRHWRYPSEHIHTATDNSWGLKDFFSPPPWPWNPRTWTGELQFPVRPCPQLQGALITWANAFKWSLLGPGGNYWLWEHWPHSWEIT